jgi:hypothetical protein
VTEPAPSQNPPSSGQGRVEKPPEAGPIAPPAWRELFAGPVLQPGEEYSPLALGWLRQKDEAARTQVRPVAGPAPDLDPGRRPARRQAPSPAEPVVGPVPEPERPSREGSVGVARGSAEAAPGQRAEQARQATDQANRLAGRMRPLAADAAVFAARALDLGARGLAGLATRLADRQPRDEPPGR